MDVLSPHGQALRALDGLCPYTWFVRIHFAISILAHAAAWTITQVFWAAHGTGQSGRMENTLSTHPAIEKDLLTDFFDRQEDPLKYFCGSGIL